MEQGEYIIKKTVSNSCDSSGVILLNSNLYHDFQYLKSFFVYGFLYSFFFFFFLVSFTLCNIIERLYIHFISGYWGLKQKVTSPNPKRQKVSETRDTLFFFWCILNFFDIVLFHLASYSASHVIEIAWLMNLILYFFYNRPVLKLI